jgi:hypothetical protein
MTPKEKAKELILKFKELPQEGTIMFYLAFEISKQCALIAVDEVINNSPLITEIQNYWLDVKKEIEKL